MVVRGSGAVPACARTLKVTLVPGHEPAQLVKLTVTVRWDREGQPRVLERSRYRARLRD